MEYESMQKSAEDLVDGCKTSQGEIYVRDGETLGGWLTEDEGKSVLN